MTTIYSLSYFGDSGRRRVQPCIPTMERLYISVLCSNLIALTSLRKLAWLCLSTS